MTISKFVGITFYARLKYLRSNEIGLAKADRKEDTP